MREYQISIYIPEKAQLVLGGGKNDEVVDTYLCLETDKRSEARAMLALGKENGLIVNVTRIPNPNLETGGADEEAVKISCGSINKA